MKELKYFSITNNILISIEQQIYIGIVLIIYHDDKIMCKIKDTNKKIKFIIIDNIKFKF